MRNDLAGTVQIVLTRRNIYVRMIIAQLINAIKTRSVLQKGDLVKMMKLVITIIPIMKIHLPHDEEKTMPMKRKIKKFSNFKLMTPS